MKTKLSTIGLAFLLAILLQSSFTSCSEMDNLLYTDDMERDISIGDSAMKITNLPNQAKTLYKVTLDDTKNLLKALQYNERSKIEAFEINRDTLLYIVNHNKGWTIIAGDKRINPIIAESDKGMFLKSSINENLMTWIASYADALRVFQSGDTLSIKTNNKVTENEYTKLWSRISPDKQKVNLGTTKAVEYKWAVVAYTYFDRETSNIVIPHLISTKWGQEYPWNSKLPIDTSNGSSRCPTGCTAVSVAQIIYYMHNFLGKPTGLYHNISISSTSISGETSNIGFSRSNYVSSSTRWNDMALSYNSSGNTTYVGDLMLDIGNRLNMKYSGNGSSASISNSALSNYNLTCTESDYNYQKIKNNLQNSKPVNITAYRKDASGQKFGHSWIIDGLATKTRYYITRKHFEYTENWMHESEYYDTFDQLREKYHINSEYDIIFEENSSTGEYLLMNWGYDGDNDNGYFSTYPDASWTNGSREYKYDKKIHYDFR